MTDPIRITTPLFRDLSAFNAREARVRQGAEERIVRQETQPEDQEQESDELVLTFQTNREEVRALRDADQITEVVDIVEQDEEGSRTVRSRVNVFEEPRPDLQAGQALNTQPFRDPGQFVDLLA